ncbi:hypothetical protein EFA46_002380 [Halarchaeum sp. CBA1220]|uniref:hypothetical protein n=1 Tax=Halarchaeum sp. CBA1220 TaxID=1853682 RepID=UPI000F3A8C1F|nr:hypothetical protein [Halarchaeum sp. CBA1220]QLC33101.1 hypothetical protein EFA46_002380 [Halarchaeum sp. CBA1220]
MQRDDTTGVERTASEPGATRHDLVLAAIPLVLLGGAFGGVIADVGIRTGIAVGSTGAAAVLGYALFGDPPVGRGGGGRSAS